MTISKKIVLSVLVIMACLIVIVATSYFTVNKFYRSFDLEKRSYDVLINVEKVLTEIVNVEVGQRGYIITGNEEYLKPYNDALIHLGSVLRNIRELTQNNYKQQDNISKLYKVIALKLAESRRTINLCKTSGFNAAQEIVAGEQERKIMVEIRKAIKEIQEEENSLLLGYMKHSIKTKNVLYLVLGVSFVVALFLVVFVTAFFIYSFSRPLIKLKRAAVVVSEGDFDVDVEVSSNDEIGQLAKAFKAMTNKLKDAMFKEKALLVTAQESLARSEKQNVRLEENKKAMMNLVNDINLQKESLSEAYFKLEQSQSQLIQSEKMSVVGTMVAGVAHELNNPMMGMVNFIQYCLKHTSKDDKRYEVLCDAEKETKRCVKIVENLLTFSRMDKEGEEGRQLVSCKSILERVLTLLNYRVIKEKVSISISGNENVPMVMVGVNSIQQVFLNIISNAFDALKPMSIRDLQIDLVAKDSRVQISIKDSGPGIDEKTLSKIFDPFFTTKPAGYGTGLGLSLSRSIVEDNGGKIYCESVLGQGTTFRILLPIS